MRARAFVFAGFGLLAITGGFAESVAAGAIEGGGRQALNVPAIIMFVIFVAATLGITKWAASRTRSAADFYAAGGGITGFQNGLAIAGDYMSAASFLGISGLVFATGFAGPWTCSAGRLLLSGLAPAGGTRVLSSVVGRPPRRSTRASKSRGDKE